MDNTSITAGAVDLNCEYCQKLLSSSSNPKTHIALCHTEETLKTKKCSICGKQFLRSCDLRVHVASHNGQKHDKLKFRCSSCHGGFALNKSYERHVKTHEIKSFKCTKCNFMTHSMELINSHKKIHTAEMPYSCTVCLKRFKHQPSFTFHKRTHTGERPFKCDQCTKEFTQSTHLLTHKRGVHTKDRNFPCDVCNKSFNSNPHLKVHIQVHTEDRKYKCFFMFKNL